MSLKASLPRGQLALFLLLLNQTISANAAIPDCSNSAIRCVGPELEYNTSIEYPEKAFQAAVDAAKPGDTIYIKGGTYEHKAGSSSKYFMNVTVSGTAAAPITIQSFDGELAHLKGFGYREGTEGPSILDERLIYIDGNYIHVKHLELSYSSRYGMVLGGSYGLAENLSIHDNWDTNLLINGPHKDIEHNTVRYIESYRSRHSTGIWIRPGDNHSPPTTVTDTVVENSLTYNNGFQADGAKVPSIKSDPAGGGNSDGIGTFKGCAELASKRSLPSLCSNTILRGNITWHNADDGFDVSSGDGSQLIDNISYENGPEGNKGYKVYAQVLGGISFIGNIAMGNVNNGFEIQVEEAGYIYNNTAVRNGLHGFRTVLYNDAFILATNNLGAYNTGSIDIDVRDGIKNTTNWAANKDGDPLIAESTFKNTAVNNDVLITTRTIAQKVLAIKNQFQRALTPLADSPLVDAGTLIPDLHCPRADDDATEPMSPTQDCRHWYGKAPDIGAYEYGAPLFNPPMPPTLIVQ